MRTLSRIGEENSERYPKYAQEILAMVERYDR